MTEPERAKPQYGEYASEEEYASALKRSGVDPDHVLTPVTPSPDISRGVSPPSSPRSHSQTSLQHGLLDRVVTMFLLAFGIVSIIGSAPNYLNLSETLQEALTQMGIGEYHLSALTSGFGIAMVVSQVVLWMIAAVWSFRRISRGKRAWWLPLLAGAVSFLVLTVLLGALIAADPSFIPALAQPR